MQTFNQNSVPRGQNPFTAQNGLSVLDIRHDSVFKAVFTRDTPESRGALSSLLSALIGKIVSVETIIANEPPSNGMFQRNIRYDISCRTTNGKLVNIEMSLHPNADELNRLEYYVSRLFVMQDIRGSEKHYWDLKETFQIAIIARETFFQDEYLTHQFEYYDPAAAVSLKGKTRIITMELEKAVMAIEKSAVEMTGAEAWAAFFQYLTDNTKSAKIEEIMQHEGGIAMAAETLHGFSEEEKQYLWQMSRDKFELDNQSRMAFAKKAARQEGLKQGKLETNLENARKMKADNMSVSQISKYTGLSEQQILDM